MGFKATEKLVVLIEQWLFIEKWASGGGGRNLREQTCFHTLLLTAFSVRLDVEITEVI